MAKPGVCQIHTSLRAISAAPTYRQPTSRSALQAQPPHPGGVELTSQTPRPKSRACLPAQVAELVDALRSGRSGRKAVEVQVLSWAPQAICRPI